MRSSESRHRRECDLATLLRGQYGAAARNQLRSLGYSDSAIATMIKSGRLEIILPGVVRATASPLTWELEAMAGCLRSIGNIWLSHGSAAVIHRFNGFEKNGLELTSTRRLRPQRGHEIHLVGEMPICDVETVRNLPITTPVRTLIDLAAVVDEETLEIALDDAVYTGKVRLPRLRWRLDELGGKKRPGVTNLRSLLEARGDGVMVPTTVLETKLVRVLRTARLPVAQTQHRFHENGHFVARVDFAYPEQRVIIEVDGARWHSGRQARIKDAQRDNYFNLKGWTVLRFTWEDLERRPEHVARQVALALGVSAMF